jgi:predicted nucleotide-binding protein
VDAIAEKIEHLMDLGWKAANWSQWLAWVGRVDAFLDMTLGKDAGTEFREVAGGDPLSWESRRERVMGLLEGIVAARVQSSQAVGLLSAAQAPSVAVPKSKRVFVVHGHDDGSKETVARYLERLGLQSVILHEQANEGRTVIEKIEAHSDVGFAVVLLTPDDVGASKAYSAHSQPRARQNVILELGYFVGKLKRSRVCALYVPGVEIPSDFSGVLYIELDSKGAWRTQLAQELSNARMPINVAGLLNS